MAKGKYGPITDDLDLIVGAEEPTPDTESRMIAPEPTVESGELVESVELSFHSEEGFVPAGMTDQVIKEEVTSFITEVVAATNALEAHAINEAPEVIAEIKTEKVFRFDFQVKSWISYSLLTNFPFLTIPIKKSMDHNLALFGLGHHSP